MTTNPNKAWDEISQSQNVIKINYEPPESKNTDPEMIRVVCMSDTHSQIHRMSLDVPDGDVLIHAGDFTNVGSAGDVERFNQWLGELTHKHKVVIAGNHELSFDPKCNHPLAAKKTSPKEGFLQRIWRNKETKPDEQNPRDLLTNCIYLEDSGVELFGLKFWGSPHQPWYGNWAFNVQRGQELLDKWNLIPPNIDILITHGPPLGFNDLCNDGSRAGCVELLSTVQRRVKPKFHVFGHIHEDYGISSDGKTTFINASTCNIAYKPINPPIVIDIAIEKRSD